MIFMNAEVEDFIIPLEQIAQHIYVIRNEKVMIDSDLAKLYDVPTKRLNEQVKRNIKRFPEDFMFQLTSEELEILKSHFATSSWGGRRTLPFAFTEQGVAMLSAVLNSDRAINVNINIMRAFVRLRQYLSTNEDIIRKLGQHDQEIKNLYKHVEKLLSPVSKNNFPMGYIWDENE